MSSPTEKQMLIAHINRDCFWGNRLDSTRTTRQLVEDSKNCLAYVKYDIARLKRIEKIYLKYKPKEEKNHGRKND